MFMTFEELGIDLIKKNGSTYFIFNDRSFIKVTENDSGDYRVEEHGIVYDHIKIRELTQMIFERS